MAQSDDSDLPEPWQQKLLEMPWTQRSGNVTAVLGTIVKATIPDVQIGQIVRIEKQNGTGLLAEVVGFDRQDVILMPLGGLTGVPVKAPITPLESSLYVPAGDATLGRVVNALGMPIDGKGDIDGSEQALLIQSPPNALLRKRITEKVSTGVRAIDGLLTIGRGQRVGIFAAAGVGKSTLLGMIARNIDADRVVVALIGERGREVRSFLEDNLGDEGMKKTTVVVSTSNEPALLRARAAHAATAIAEAARDKGERVVLMMDSVTRFARALREIGLAVGEPPGRQGYPASVMASLPTLFERAGNDQHGSITAFYTVLVAGDDLEEPIADETISLLDGHIILSRKVKRYPAIDLVNSKSRLISELAAPEHLKAHATVDSIVKLYDKHADKIDMGFYNPDDPRDKVLAARIKDVDTYAKQGTHEVVPLQDSIRQLVEKFST